MDSERIRRHIGDVDVGLVVVVLGAVAGGLFGATFWWWRCWGPGWSACLAARQRAERGPNDQHVPHVNHSVSATTGAMRWTRAGGHLGVLTISADHLGLYVKRLFRTYEIVWLREDGPSLVLLGPGRARKGLSVTGPSGSAWMDIRPRRSSEAIIADLERFGWESARAWA